MMSEHSLIIEGKMGSDKAARKKLLIERRSAQILVAAAKVFAEKGFHKATIREIAAEAGVAEGTIYNYFDSKDDLLVSIPKQLGEASLARLIEERVRVDEEDDEEFLRSLLNEAFERLMANVDFVKVLFSSLPTMDEETKEEYLRRVPLYFGEVFEKYLTSRIKRGTFREMDTAIAARAFMGMFVIFLLSQELLPGRRITPFDYDQVVREIVRLFLYGVKVCPPEKVSA